MDKKQTFESLHFGLLLALSGGFMDAYSYICRGEVFANAQTGNIILLGISLFEQEYLFALNYFVPILFFSLGVFITDSIKWKFSSNQKLPWQKIIIVIEMFVFIGVSFLSQKHNLVANSITSLACGMQVEAFRKIRGHTIATTMCIGNLRSGTENIFNFLAHRNKSHLKKAALYFLLILTFMLGAVLGNFVVQLIQEKAIIISALFMLIALLS